MFGIGGWEFVLIAVLALMLFGPDKLPQIARTLGRFMRDIKRYQNLVESTVRGEILAAEFDTPKKDQFETGKAFRERVASGGFTKPEPKPEVEPEADSEVEPEAEPAEPVDAEPTESEDVTDASVEPLPISDDGEGERDEA